MKETLENLIKGFVGEDIKFVVEHPTNMAFGDYSTNAGIVSKRVNELFEYLEKNKPAEVEKVEVKNGFINFYLSKEFFKNSLKEITKKGGDFGRNKKLKEEKVMVEYTDPNVMKPFHIGHLMSNSVGEAISRIIEWSGAQVVRANYYSDSGLGIAKALWGMMERQKDLPKDASTSEKAKFLGSAYVYGVEEFDKDDSVQAKIKEINRKIFDKSDKEINKFYELGKYWSLEHFKELYERLGSKFDWSVGESEIAEAGKKIVLENPGVFVESDGAFVFNGELHDPSLHTRVFINSDGLPTYEAKEVGLTQAKFEKFTLDESIVITANEQNDYFKVVLAAIRLMHRDWADKTKHLSHGILKLPTGKMSSRTGDVITAESLIEEVKSKVKDDERVAIGAIKYMILRANIGGDIIFDIDKSVSTEGDSGVYLQYAHARANSLLERAKESGLPALPDREQAGEVREVEKLLYRFPEVVERALGDYAPHYITTYLTELASSFNNFYAHEHVIGDAPEAAYRLAIVEAFKIVMQNGLNILGIPAPERM